jgi:hypothetical protein
LIPCFCMSLQLAFDMNRVPWMARCMPCLTAPSTLSFPSNRCDGVLRWRACSNRDDFAVSIDLDIVEVATGQISTKNSKYNREEEETLYSM